MWEVVKQHKTNRFNVIYLTHKVKREGEAYMRERESKMNRNHSKISHAIEPATNSIQRLVYSKLIIRRGFFNLIPMQRKNVSLYFFCFLCDCQPHVRLNRIYVASSQSESELNPNEENKSTVSDFQALPLLRQTKRLTGVTEIPFKMWKCQMS